MAKQPKEAGTEPKKETNVFAAARDEALRHGMQYVACAFAELAGEPLAPAKSYRAKPPEAQD